jgi:hypothetical protein
MKMANTGADFESYVQYVYTTLLNLRGEKIQVSRRTTFSTLSGESYEIDVYYEFYKAGVRHRVAIECKDWSRPVNQGQILEFQQRIKNIGDDFVGVFISRVGFQDGAERVAARHGILTLTKDTLPTLTSLIGMQLKSSAIHEPNLVGEPFWVIAELSSEGHSTGSYYAFPPGFDFKFPLFISKRHAEAYRTRLPDCERWGVFGMPQYKLRVFAGFAEIGKLRLALIYGEPNPDGSVRALPIAIDAATIRRDYLV